MKIELIEEVQYGIDVMYAVRVNDQTAKWFAHKKDAESFYDALIADPSLIEAKRNILKSDEVVVSLES